MTEALTPLTSPLVSLILQSVGMLVGTLICGTIPLHVPLSKTKLRVLEVMGAGLLVGASMTVVLPEGVSALFRSSSGHNDVHAVKIPLYTVQEGNPTGSWTWATDAPDDHHNHGDGEHGHGTGPESLMGFALLGGFLVMFLIDQIAAPGAHVSSHSHPTPSSDREQQRTRPASSFLPSHRPEALRLTRASSLSVARIKQQDGGGEGLEHAKQSSTPESSPEQLPADHDHVSGHHSPLLGSASGRGSPSQSQSRRLSDAGDRDGLAASQKRGLRSAFASIAGLVIHAAADGIAMGASAGSGNDSLKLIVLFAIMIHKAPASFGLCTLLMGRRLHKRDIRKAILIFSMSTPTGAILTYLFLSLIMSSESGDNISSRDIGVALTFSAGTFIFVAMHAVQELASASADVDQGEANDSSNASQQHSHRHASAHEAKQILGRTGRVAVFLLGTVLPKMLQSLVGHGH